MVVSYFSAASTSIWSWSWSNILLTRAALPSLPNLSLRATRSSQAAAVLAQFFPLLTLHLLSPACSESIYFYQIINKFRFPIHWCYAEIDISLFLIYSIYSPCRASTAFIQSKSWTFLCVFQEWRSGLMAGSMPCVATRPNVGGSELHFIDKM